MPKKKDQNQSEDLHLVEDEGVASVSTGDFPEHGETLENPTQEKATTRMEQRTERLECIITDVRLLEYSKQLTEHIRDKSGLEDTLKSVKSQIKSEIDGHIASINLLSGKISSGKEFEPVDVEIHYDYNTRFKTYIRTDTGQDYKIEPIRQDEIQLHLDLEETRLEKENNDKNNP